MGKDPWVKIIVRANAEAFDADQLIYIDQALTNITLPSPPPGCPAIHHTETADLTVCLEPHIPIDVDHGERPHNTVITHFHVVSNNRRKPANLRLVPKFGSTKPL
jgi:hypothetical protein